MLARLALSDLDSDVGLVDSVLLVIIVLLVNIDFVLFIVFPLLLFVGERSAGFLLGLIFFQLFEVLLKVVLVIFLQFDFVQVLNQGLFLLSLLTSLRLFFCLSIYYILLILPSIEPSEWPWIQGQPSHPQQARQQLQTLLFHWSPTWQQSRCAILEGHSLTPTPQQASQ